MIRPNGLRYWFGEPRTDFANGRNSTKKLPIRRRRKPNPVHAMLGTVLTGNDGFERFWSWKRMFKTKKINQRKTKLNKNDDAESNNKKAFPHFTAFGRKVDYQTIAENVLLGIEQNWLLTDGKKKRSCGNHKLCQKRRAKRQINRLKKQELAKAQNKLRTSLKNASVAPEEKPR